MSESAIAFMDNIGLTIDKLNDFGAALNKLGLDSDTAAQRISRMFELIGSGASVSNALGTVFSDLLSQYDPNSKEYKALYNNLLNAYQKAAGTGLLNQGQNLKALQSQINGFYEKAAQ